MTLKELKTLCESLQLSGATDDSKITFWLNLRAERAHRSKDRSAFIELELESLNYMHQNRVWRTNNYSIPLKVDSSSHPDYLNWS